MTNPDRLLAWYDNCRRDLPWRRTRNPYRIWVSEVMLQQTRVETVLPYFKRFLARFPTVEELGQAPVEEVLALWSGLGYYRRARRLHLAAQAISSKEGFPKTSAGLKALPGVGDYTAAAIASIAFGEVVPVMDGNVERVTSRLLGSQDSPKASGVRRRLLAEAAALVDPSRPGDSNQALMELGATVCLPRNPACSKCPLGDGCRGLASGDPEQFPSPPRKRATEEVHWTAILIEDGERFLLVRRSVSDTVLAGTWELPWFEGPQVSNDEVDLGSLAESFRRRYGGKWRIGPVLTRLRHSITYRRISVTIRSALLEEDRLGLLAEGPEAGWFERQDLAALPTSSLLLKVARRLWKISPDQRTPQKGRTSP